MRPWLAVSACGIPRNELSDRACDLVAGATDPPREVVAPERWSSPTFKAINRRLTILWASVFAAMVPAHVIAGTVDARRGNLIFNWAIPIALVLYGLERTTAVSETARPERVAPHA